MLRFFLAILMVPTYGLADQMGYDQAIDHLRSALIQTRMVRIQLRKTENRIKDYAGSMGIEEHHALYVAWAVPLVSQRISTSMVSNLRMEGDNWILRPDLDYRFEGTMEARINLNVNF